MNDIIKKLPKVELHLHLDGSVPLEVAEELSSMSMEILKKEMIASDKCENLSEYLTKFDLPISIMQTRDNLIRISKALVDYLEKENSYGPYQSSIGFCRRYIGRPVA